MLDILIILGVLIWMSLISILFYIIYIRKK